MAATTGLGHCSTRASTLRRMGSASWAGLPNSLTSAPAENALSLPMSTIALTVGSASAASMAATMRERSAWPRLLTGGLSSVMTWMREGVSWEVFMGGAGH